ncbi:MAG: glutamate mutase L, partial [Terrabacter sp.]
HARTVEGDLGMRWNAEHVVEAAEAEHLFSSVRDAEALRAYAARVHERPGSLPVDDTERALDLELARLAALVAVRRHARPAQPTEAPRPLANVTALVGSGGVLRHTDDAGRDRVLGAVLADHAGGWKVPRAASATVDTAYLLFAAGLLATDAPDVAAAVAGQITR